MILTCPKCATRFFADDHAIGPSGRRVKCDACGHVWSVAGAKSVSSTDHGGLDVGGPASAADPVQDAVSAGDSREPVATPLFVERVPPARRVQRSGRPWALAALALAFVVVAGVFVFQRQIAHMFPGASALYQSVGLRGSDLAGG